MTETTATTTPASRPDKGESPASPHLVVVPREPGRLRNLDRTGGRSRDELDDLIDDVFGPSTDERPGLFDAALIGLGLVLVAWGILLGGGEMVRWLGLVAILLGIALPLRGVIRGFGRQRTRAARDRAVGDGYLLDAGHPAVSDLVRAFGGLVDAARLPSVREPRRIIGAGHLAVVEVATLLKGGPPAADEQVAYVMRRTEAVGSLTTDLLRAHERWLAGVTAENEARATESREWAAAVTAAREELETTVRTGSLSELDLLGDQLRQDAPDGSA